MKDERVLAQLSAHQLSFFAILVVAFGLLLTERIRKDRKSTRLNSSHANISYAVFCLKKKKTALVDTTRVRPKLHSFFYDHIDVFPPASPHELSFRHCSNYVP